ncbi:MAG TPA: DUF6165 family protein [Steroidobacteraceae bacterium]|nr:DUF6165 family protein [Steroidobacteraceae bacterium]
MGDILVPISPGELLDKITILRIKARRLTEAAQRANVELELRLLLETWRASGCEDRSLPAEEQALERVNERLWEIEDRIREHESARRFDAEFIELARSVYLANDERAAIKKRINRHFGSRLVEEKSYRPYRQET